MHIFLIIIALLAGYGFLCIYLSYWCWVFEDLLMWEAIEEWTKKRGQKVTFK